MQINITNTGPTMAASEPPEPPPRNPERINATLHKLAESVSTRSVSLYVCVRVTERAYDCVCC